MELPAALDGVDRNLLYLGLVIALIAVPAAAHNLMTDDATRSFGLCDISVNCAGPEVADICLWVEKKDVSCIDPRNATTVQRAEAECALDAQGICNANPELSGTAWTDNPNATFQGTSCAEWGQQDEVELLACEDTFNDITQWS